jgi:calcineurin-like phosphoesterase family protein
MTNKIWVYSDPHYGHANIIKFCNRPFSSVEEMDSTLIKNHNSVVGDNDLVICNGDFMFYKNDTGIFNSLKGHKILVKGNHDHKVAFSLGWESVHTRYEFVHNSKHVVMDHYPLENWNKKFHGSIHLYGHVHDENGASKVSNIPRRYNICVEMIGYKPVDLDFYTKGE